MTIALKPYITSPKHDAIPWNFLSSFKTFCEWLTIGQIQFLLLYTLKFAVTWAWKYKFQHKDTVSGLRTNFTGSSVVKVGQFQRPSNMVIIFSSSVSKKNLSSSYRVIINLQNVLTGNHTVNFVLINRRSVHRTCFVSTSIYNGSRKIHQAPKFGNSRSTYFVHICSFGASIAKQILLNYFFYLFLTASLFCMNFYNWIGQF